MGRGEIDYETWCLHKQARNKEVCGGSSVSYTLSVKIPRQIWRGMMWKVFLADCSSATI